MTRKKDTSHPPKGNGAAQAPGGYVDPSRRKRHRPPRRRRMTRPPVR